MSEALPPEELAKYATWKAPQTGQPTERSEAEPARDQEPEGSPEELLENELIVADDQLVIAKQVLQEHSIPQTDRQYKPRLNYKTETGAEAAVPGEYVLTILDSSDGRRPASQALVRQAFLALEESGISVRYGKVPS